MSSGAPSHPLHELASGAAVFRYFPSSSNATSLRLCIPAASTHEYQNDGIR